MKAEHLAALRLICARLQGRGLNWALTGSVSFALQGLPVEVHDIDVQADREGAYAIERCLSEFVQQPVSFSGTDRIRSHFGVLSLDGVRVEIMGDIQKRLPDGGWEEPVDPGRYVRWVEVEGMVVPVLFLEYERRAYEVLGRTEKARMLEAWLQR